MKHLLGIRQLNDKDLTDIFTLAESLERARFSNSRINKTMISFFGEPSTRTRFSFEAAAKRLGMDVLTAADASVSSSLKKGESWKDTFRTLSQYGDVIVCRHADPDWTHAAKLFSRIPVVNAGNGGDEHPTQALLDAYTIKKEIGKLDNLKVMICGDLLHARTVHSLVYLLRHHYDAQVFCVPAANCELELPSCTHITAKQVEEFLPQMDVVYMTRMQTERHQFAAGDYFRLRHPHLSFLKEKMCILHPLPRGDEICQQVDDDPRAAYHERQIKNGLWVRMALLKMLLDG